MYKIGTYRDGQQVANEVYSSNKLSDIKTEFKRIFENTVEECSQDAIDFGWDEGTVNNTTFKQAWEHKHFSEDVNNVAVFKVKGDGECWTNYIYTGLESNKI